MKKSYDRIDGALHGVSRADGAGEAELDALCTQAFGANTATACRASVLRTSLPQTGCPTITCTPCWWMGIAIWAGTDNGLGLYENGKWKTFTTKDGLAHRAVLSLALDKRTGDVWAGTMGGLSRISGGRIDTFTQLNSGLSNDVVYGVSVEGENVWVATAAGGVQLEPASRASGRSTTSATRR